MICDRCGGEFYPSPSDERPYLFHLCDDLPLEHQGHIMDNPRFWGNARRGVPGAGDTRNKELRRDYVRRVYDR